MTMTLTTTTGSSLATQAFVELCDKSLRDWIKYLDVRPRTVDTYFRAVRQFAKFLAVNGIKNPTRDDVLKYRETLKKTCKPSTVQSYIIALRLFFNWAKDSNIWQGEDIMDRVKGDKTDREHKKDPLTPAQASDVLAKINRDSQAGKRDVAILALMLTTGLRVSSVVSANIGDLRPVGDSLALYYQGKGHSEKAVFVKIAPKVEKVIREYLATRKSLDSNSPLFASDSNRNSGKRLTPRSISRLVKTHLIDAGLNSDRLTAHSLRHTCATINLLAGGSLEETQQLLNHVNINTTMIYAQALKRAESKAEKRIADAIDF